MGEPDATGEPQLVFHGSRAACGPLIQGQRIMWNILASLDWQGAHLNQRITLQVPGRVSLGETLDRLRLIIERHEVLRTHFLLAPTGEPVQQVLDHGALTVTVVDGDERFANELCARLAATPFREDTELPVRVGVVMSGGRPVHLVLVLSHLAVDAWSRAILKEDLRTVLADGPAGLPAVIEQPLDRAAYEDSPAGLARQRAAVRYWRENLMSLPVEMFGGGCSPVAADYDNATLTSPAAAHALSILANRYGTTRSSCLLATVALLAGLHTGTWDSALWIVVATRFRRQSRRLVATFNQNALFRPDWSVSTFAEFVRTSVSRAITAYVNSEYRPAELDRVVAEVEQARGCGPLRGWYYNDVTSMGADAGDDTDVDPESLPQMRSRSVLATTDELDGQVGHSIFFRVRTLTGRRAVLSLTAHRAVLPSGGAARWLTDLESVLVTACLTESTLAELATAHGVH